MIYFSKHSMYHTDNGELYRGQNQKLGKFYYVSSESLEELLEKHDIPKNKRVELGFRISDRLKDDLKQKFMPLNEAKGRFVVFLEREGGNSELSYTGEITKVEEELSIEE